MEGGRFQGTADDTLFQSVQVDGDVWEFGNTCSGFSTARA
jgi:hypothetical protein